MSRTAQSGSRLSGRNTRRVGSAAKSAAKGMRAHGYSTIAKPESFWVDGVTGPLLDGELERARTWGEQLAAAASAPAAVK